jgi:hypothetical protein
MQASAVSLEYLHADYGAGSSSAGRCWAGRTDRSSAASMAWNSQMPSTIRQRT